MTLLRKKVSVVMLHGCQGNTFHQSGGSVSSWKSTVTWLTALSVAGTFSLSPNLFVQAFPITPRKKMAATKGLGFPRVELFFSSSYQMREKVRWLTDHGFHKFNLVNKNEHDDLLGCVKGIHSIDPSCDVCVHYSLKYRKARSRKVQDHANRLHSFLNEASTCRGSNTSVLVVSGSRPAYSWTTVEAVHSLSHSHMPVAVAFNPFLPKLEDRAVEYHRLHDKFLSGKVKQVYLQFGIDLELAQEGLDHILQVHRDVHITASIFLPTAKLLEQQRARPWYGVFLNETDYLQDTTTAFQTTVRLLQLYKAYGVEILIEAPGLQGPEELQLWNALQQAMDKQPVDKSFTPMKRVGSPPFNSSVKKSQKATKRKGGNTVAKSTKKVTQPTPVGMQPSIKEGIAIVLFGSHDVRVKSNFALDAAMRQYTTILPVLLWEPNQPEWGVIGALQVVYKDAIRNLQTQLSGHSRLKILCRNTDDAVAELFCIAQECDAAAVFWNREMTPEGSKIEERRRQALKALKPTIQLESHQSFLTYDIERVDLISGYQGGHWGTLMPFLKACQNQLGEPQRPIEWDETKRLLKRAKPPQEPPAGCKIKELDMAIMPMNTPWDLPILKRFPMTEKEAQVRMERFFQFGLPKYETARSRADWDDATSQLSMHIRLGTLSIHELYWKIKEDTTMSWDEKKTFYRRLYWRDLAYYQLQCFPHMRETSVREHYEDMEWVTGEEASKRLKAWQRGRTGYPMVDAGMRELYATGWMNQTVRMIVASFLTEYLRLHWIHGARWFHETLVDADQAINSMMWQNAGRSGLDQWNFVLSPINASQDPTGDYVRKWLPELRNLTNRVLHQPWKASPDELRAAGVRLGDTYPHRVIGNLTLEQQKSAANVVAMRRKAQARNSAHGYDVVTLPNGVDTMVFTRRCYRIDRRGELIDGKAQRTPNKKTQKNKRRSPGRSRAPVSRSHREQ